MLTQLNFSHFLTSYPVSKVQTIEAWIIPDYEIVPSLPLTYIIKKTIKLYQDIHIFIN